MNARLFFMRAGNYGAGVLLYLFGCSVWIMMGLFVSAMLCSSTDAYVRQRFFRRCAGLVLLTIISAIYCTVVPYELYAYVEPGGIVGNAVHSSIIRAGLAEVEQVILDAGTVIAALLIFGVSWVTPVCQRAVRCTRFVAHTRAGCAVFSVLHAIKNKTAVFSAPAESAGERETDDLERCVQAIVTGKMRDSSTTDRHV